MSVSSIIRTISLALFGLLPVFFLPLGWASVPQSKMLLIALLSLAVALVHAYATYRDRTIVFPKSSIAIAALFLPLVYLVSALLAGAAPSSFVSGLGGQETVAAMTLLLAVLLHVSLSFGGARDATVTFFRAFLAGALVLMAVQVLHVFVPAATLGVLSAGASSIFGTWHEVGILAGLCIFFVSALWRTPILTERWRAAAVALAVLSAIMLIVVNMVDVWFSFGGLMLILALYTWFASRGSALVPIVVAIVIALAAFAAGAFGSALYQSLPAKLQVLQVEVRPSWQGTFTIGKQSVKDVRTALAGSGPNTFTRQWSLYKPVGVNATEFWNVDFNTGAGFIATTFVTVGAFGLLAWAALLAALLWGVRRFFAVREEGAGRATYAALLGGALYLAAFHVLYVPTITLSALTFILLGVIATRDGVRSWRFALKSDSWEDFVRAVVFALAVILVILASLLTVRATVSDMLVNRSAALYARNLDTERALSSLQLALRIYPKNDRGHRAAVELGLIRLGELAASGGPADQAKAALQVSIETTIQHGLAAVSINDSDYQNWLALATLYGSLAGAGVQGAYERAQEAYVQAYEDNPQNPLPLVQLAQLDIARKNYDQARALLDRAVGLKLDFAAAYFLRSHVHMAQEKFDAATRDAETVVRIAPEDALGWYNLGSILYAAGSYETAAQALERSVALQRDYADARMVLALSYDRLGRPQDALDALNEVLATNPADENLKAMIANIRSGRPAAGAVQGE